MKPSVERAREAGLVKVRRGMTEQEDLALRQAAGWVALNHAEFTSDDVWARFASQGHTVREPRALGALMEIMRKKQVIRSTDRYRPSTRKECHGRKVQVWQSLVKAKAEGAGGR